MADVITEDNTTDVRMFGKLGDRTSSDVIVRLRTTNGKDDWYYCHSSIICEQSKYFAARLSEEWPTCHVLDSRNCVEVFCAEADVDYHITLLRIMYTKEEFIADSWHNVKHALGILKIARKLGCDVIGQKCMQYLEAVPWEENEEEEILKAFPMLGSSVSPVLARVQPVDSAAVRNVFISAVQVATFSQRTSLESFPVELKAAAQEQVEYMLVEDDDAPLLVADDSIKVELKKCFSNLFEGFKIELNALLSDEGQEADFTDEHLLEKVSDLCWASRVLPRVGLLREMVTRWVETSNDLLKVLNDDRVRDSLWEIKFKVVDLASKVLEAVGYGTVIIPTEQRTHLVKLWLPYIREVKPLLDANFMLGKLSQRVDAELSQTIELAFVSLIMSLPSSDQAEILTDWLRIDQARYPDLTEAFEVWCFRSKSAKRRFTSDVGSLESLSSTGCAS